MIGVPITITVAEIPEPGEVTNHPRYAEPQRVRLLWWCVVHDEMAVQDDACVSGRYTGPECKFHLATLLISNTTPGRTP